MSKKLLVTSALPSTWSNKEFMIFLGDWCKKDNNFSSLDKENIRYLNIIGMIDLNLKKTMNILRFWRKKFYWN